MQQTAELRQSVTGTLWRDGDMYFCHLRVCFLSAPTAFATSLRRSSRSSLLDLSVGARTPMRSLRGSSRSTASRDKSAAPLSAGGVRGSRCNLGSQIQIYDSSHGRDTGAG